MVVCSTVPSLNNSENCAVGYHVLQKNIRLVELLFDKLSLNAEFD